MLADGLDGLVLAYDAGHPEQEGELEELFKAFAQPYNLFNTQILVAGLSTGRGGAKEKLKPKSIMDGFDKSHPYINGTNKYRTPAMKLHMEIPQIEGMLRDKLQSRLKGGPGGLRRAFKHFDTDGSGTISHEELHQVLQNFNMNLKDGDFDSL